jgi:hypothetical protein
LRFGSIVGHFGVLVPLACLGVVVTWHERRRLWVLYAMIAAYSASVLLFFVYARYRFALVPFLVLFASAGAIWLVEFARGQFTETAAPAAYPASAVARTGGHQRSCAGVSRAIEKVRRRSDWRPSRLSSLLTGQSHPI